MTSKFATIKTGIPATLLSLALAFAPAPVRAAGETFPPFDPGAILYSPRSTALPGCGFSIGLDPAWRMKKEGSGKRVNVSSHYDFDIFKKVNKHAFAKIAGFPYAFILVLCSPADAKESTKTMAERISREAGEGVTLISRPSVSGGGVGAAGDWLKVSYRERRGRETVFTRVTYVSVHKGVKRTIAIFMGEGAKPQGTKVTVPAGGSYTYVNGGRTIGTAVLKRQTFVPASGALFPLRNASENLSLANRIAATIK